MSTDYVGYMPVQAPDLDTLINRLLIQEGLALKVAGKQVVEGYATPPEGSPASRDRNWASQGQYADYIGGSFQTAAETVASHLNSMDEYRRGILALLGADEMLALPIMNCVRAIHEAALRICSLTDPQITSQERLARSAANFLSMVQGGLPTLRQIDLILGNQDDLLRVTEAKDGAVALFRSIGLQVQVNERTGLAQNVRCEGIVANVELKSTDLSLKYTPKIHFAYGLNSGATHSNRWLTNGLDGPWDQTLMSMMFPILDIADALVANLMGYVSMSPDGLHRATHTRRIALMRRTGRTWPSVDHRTYQGDE